MTITLRLLTMADVEDLHPRLRNEDQEEVIVLGSNPREALLLGAFDNIYPASLGKAYGIISSENGLIGAIGFSSSGHLWALSTKFKRSDFRELLERTPEITNRLICEALSTGAISTEAPYLCNVIHSRNKVAIKWLQHAGIFNVELEDPIEVLGETLYTFRTKMPYEMALTPRTASAHV